MANRKLASLVAVVALGLTRSMQAAALVAVDYVGPGCQSGLTRDSAGNLYGTAGMGGTNSDGSIFEIAVPGYRPTTLVSFSNSNYFPGSDVTFDSAGNIYGASINGGASGMGSVFELGSDRKTVTTLVSFNGSNGANPQGGLLADAAGNLYGTTLGQNINGSTAGTQTVYELSGVNHQTFTTLATFSASSAVGGPSGDLLTDNAGNIYGCTYEGGTNGDGSIFELSGPDHKTLTTLFNFNGSNGALPNGYLTKDAAGNFYGTTYGGGTSLDGTIFELSGPDHTTLTTLYNFDGSVGKFPSSGLTMDAAGNIFGTTLYGGNADGVAFELSANYQSMRTVVNFNNSISNPNCYLLPDAVGDLFGTSVSGEVFRIANTGFVVPEPSALSLLALMSCWTVRKPRRISQW